MKVHVTMKNPDTLQDAILDAVKRDVASLGLSPVEATAVVDLRFEAVSELAARWFRYGEYLDVEIDTEVETCVVLKAQR